MKNDRNAGCLAGAEATSSDAATAPAGVRAPGQRISVGFAIALQYILHRGGNVAVAGSPRRNSAIGDAFVLGLRTTVKF
jgi:hypothetical protein